MCVRDYCTVPLRYIADGTAAEKSRTHPSGAPALPRTEEDNSIRFLVNIHHGHDHPVIYFMIIMINVTMMISVIGALAILAFSADLPMRSPSAIGVRELTSCRPRPARGPCAVRITAPTTGEVRMRSPQHVARSLQPFRVLTIATQRPVGTRHSSALECFVSASSVLGRVVTCQCWSTHRRPRESPERRSPSDLPFCAPLLTHTLTRRQSDGLRRRRPRVDSRRLRA